MWGRGRVVILIVFPAGVESTIRGGDVGVSPGNAITGDYAFQGGGHTVDYPFFKSTYPEKTDNFDTTWSC